MRWWPSVNEDITQLPNRSPWAYPAYVGPGAVYPAEANVRPVYQGDGRGAYDPGVFHTEPIERQERPEITITNRETYESWDEEWYPSGPRTLAALARSAGWEVRIGFSRGPVAGQKADTWETRDIIGVWMDGYGKRAVALWERNPDAEFTAKKLEAGVKPGELPSGMKWSTSGTAIRMTKAWSWPYANLTDLKEWLALHGDVLPSWYEAIRARVKEAEERAKARAKSDP
jgi:hypothetical protein